MESYWSDAPDFKGSKVSEEWVQTNENVRLRVITWTLILRPVREW